jgi:hypothetical protein
VRNVLASLREFWLKVIRHFYVLVVGVIGGILGLASGVYGDFQAPGASPLVPLWVWLPLFAVGYGVAVIWAFHDVRMERDAVQRRATKAETDLEGARAKLADARREGDEARRELKEAQRAEIPAPAKPEPPPFKLRHYVRKTSLAGGWVTSHFVGVTNPAGQPERRAHMSAESMNPYPRNRSAVGTRPAFPHAVPPESEGTAAAGLVIGPGQEQSWSIGNTWTRPDGKISVYEFFSDTGADWELGPDERWRVSYRITCGSVPDVPFSIVIAAEEGGAVVSLQG